MTSAPPTHPLTERIAILLRGLTLKVAERSMWGPLSSVLLILIQGRIEAIKQRVRGIIGRLASGRYAPRRRSAAPAPRPGMRRAKPPGAVKYTKGWLVPLAPEAVQFRAQVLFLLQSPEMAALLAAAPGSLRRPLRSLCWMLGMPPPPSLAAPRPVPPAPQAAPSPAPPPAPRPPPTHKKLARRRPAPPRAALPAPA